MLQVNLTNVYKLSAKFGIAQGNKVLLELRSVFACNAA